MEENTFLDLNPQFGARYGMGQTLPTYGFNPYAEARDSELEMGKIRRWLNPGIAEAAQFDRENFMMDKENAFTEHMFDKSNAYNTPQAQMERAIEAGINPNLAAAGIMGNGNATAIPMQGAKGDVGMNTNATNPIEDIGTLATAVKTGVETTSTLGELFGFGDKNKAEIKLIKTNAKKAGEELRYTRQQRIQLQNIGETLIENAKKEGRKIDQEILNLQELNENYKKEREVLQADKELKEAQTGTEIEKKKSQEYENYKLQFEKQFRDMFGIELTHGERQLLIEAFLGGHGDIIIDYLSKTVTGVIKEIKESLSDLIDESRKNNSVTITDKNNQNIKFKNKRQHKKWSKKLFKQARKDYDRISRNKPNSKPFEQWFEIYLNKRGLKISDLDLK